MVKKLMVLIIALGSAPAIAGNDNFHDTKYVLAKAGMMAGKNDPAITEAMALSLGLTQNTLVEIGAGYYEVNREATYKATDGKTYIIYSNSRDMMLDSALKYYLPKISSTSVRPFFGPGVGYHMMKSEAGIEGDSDSSIKDQYSAKLDKSKTSLDVMAGLASFWASDLMVFAELKYRFIMDEKFNTTSFTAGFAMRLSDF